MSLLGEAAVAIWHDIAPEGRDEFYAWHGREHMPERVGIPGFLRGRRYQAVRADVEYFNLYEARTPRVLTGRDYQERLDSPTPWTRSVVAHYRGVARSICTVAATMGRGQGGLVSTWRYDVLGEASAEHVDAVSRQLLPKIIEDGLVAGAHLLVADSQASAVDTAEQRARAERNQIPRWVLIVEGWGESARFAELCHDALSDDILMSIGATGPAELGFYQLQLTVTPTDLESIQAQ